ncbi:transmembrane amino acid transporter protein (macronuclear) [Tetrahymena thermophila SB210]|uniref:Transmembrane amino acid transporter protein n=1 Tax=Tetrahymena thermophila (strain SB210) TaxID=312017 RepID=Q235G2_TETTS|nr:transmembrane amino acid transporter protein [Tetrahymena thermophila SB210]EAR92141.1 transmembrane amino acid transporter protein [Tetrahymena thermophila SB210]|eukprot:XP_001012386.1 transmembrane amino acid transporter protein [Tetrahymena thermophila SB210]
MPVSENSKQVDLPTLANLGFQESQQENVQTNQYNKVHPESLKDIDDTDNIEKQNVKEISNFKGKTPSWRSWIAGVNSMMGSTIVVLPVILQKNGILTCLITMIVLVVFLYKTCSFYITYRLPSEQKICQTIERILGYKWKLVFNVCNSIFLFLIQIICFLLLVSFLYPCLKVLLEDGFGLSVAEREESTYSKFSFQWLSIITTFFMFALLAKRDLSGIMKITQFGLVTVVFVVIYVFVRFGQQEMSEINLENTPLFTSNVLDIVGIFILSLQIHSVIVPVLKDNKDQSKTNRDLSIIYIISFTVYCLIAFFGVFAISGKKPQKGYPGDTILEYYSDSDPLNICIRLGLCVYLFGIYPINVYSSRVSFFSIIFKESSNTNQVPQEPSYKMHLLSNVAFCGSSLLAGLFSLNLDLVMSLSGYTVSFFTVILIPILIRIKVAQNAKIQSIKKVETEPGLKDNNSQNQENKL